MTNVSADDGANHIGSYYNDAGLLQYDPRDRQSASDLMAFDYATAMDLSNSMYKLATAGADASSRLKSIAAGVDWTGDGAKAFERAMATTTPALDTLAESYKAVSDAIIGYCASSEEYQNQFSGFAHSIVSYTADMTGLDPQDDSWLPASYKQGVPRLTHGSAAWATTSSDLATAKTSAGGVLDSYDQARETLGKAIGAAAEDAPKAPPWWEHQKTRILGELSGIKGVTKTEEQRAGNLTAAELAYEKDPSAANKQRLEEDLAAVAAIAAAANKDGKKGLATQLLDDDAASLQRMSDTKAGLIGSTMNVRSTQDDQATVVRDLKDGNVTAAIGALGAMATAAENTQKGAATVKNPYDAFHQATSEQSTANKETSASPAAPSTDIGNTAGMTPTQETKITEMVDQANQLKGLPYVYGGGHDGWGASPGYDCSGFVSKVLHAAGYLSEPETTTGLADSPGILKGPGKFVTIYDRTGQGANDHVIIDINGHWYESGGSAGAWGGGGGVEAISQPSQQYIASFNDVLHPSGL